LPAADPSGREDLQAFALQKLAKVFGEERARALLAEVLRELGLERIANVDDLEGFANALSRRSGFEATTGAMLAVRVTMLRLGT
jgi:hypothetical protein